MLSENFVDMCLDACCQVNSGHKQSKELMDNINFIFKCAIKDVSSSDSLEFKEKIDLIEYISRKRFECKDIIHILTSMSGGKFDSLVPMLKLRSETTLTEESYRQIFQTIINKRKLTEITKGKEALQEIISDIESNNYVDEEEIVYRWEEQLSKCHNILMEVRRIEATGNSSSLDVMNDSFSSVLDRLRGTLIEEECLKTGFPYLDSKLPCHGFEKQRLYLIGGTSGVGKSTMLINLICNAVKGNKKSTNSTKPDTYLYITAENLIDETWIRFFCCLKNTPNIKMVNELKDISTNAAYHVSRGDIDSARRLVENYDHSISENVKSELNNKNANVIFKYVPARATKIKDVEAIVDSVAQDNNLKGIFVDYLDLFCSGQNLELRHELGEIAQQLKNIAINYSVPVVTATQLNRDGYKIDSEPSMTQMGESMKKVDNSDFVLFLRMGDDKDVNNGIYEYKNIRATILKNRNGPVGLTHNFVMPIKKSGEDIFSFKIQEAPSIEYNNDVIKKENTEKNIEIKPENKPELFEKPNKTFG